MHILIVTDDADTATEIDSLLLPLGAQLEVLPARSRSLRSAVRGVDAAIIDIAPDADAGLELIRRFRSAHPQVPVLALCSRFQIHVQVRAIEAGAEQVAAEPLDGLAVLAGVVSMLARRQGEATAA